MPRRHPAQRGQAALELVALLPALVLVALLGWQLAVAGYAWTVASGAARAGARAQEVGAPARTAALASLPGRYARGARVDSARDGAVRVRVAVPRVVPLLPRLGGVAAEAGPGAAPP
jgi:TadE-like protein